MENRFAIFNVVGDKENLIEVLGDDKDLAINRAKEIYDKDTNVTVIVCSCFCEDGKISKNIKRVFEVFPKV